MVSNSQFLNSNLSWSAKVTPTGPVMSIPADRLQAMYFSMEMAQSAGLPRNR